MALLRMISCCLQRMCDVIAFIVVIEKSISQLVKTFSWYISLERKVKQNLSVL
jgi:hypothetical protein